VKSSPEIPKFIVVGFQTEKSGCNSECYDDKSFNERSRQNCRKKVFNRRASCFLKVGLTFCKLTKTPLIYSVSYFNLGVLGLCFGG